MFGNRSLAWLSVLALLALLAGACGGDGDSAGSADADRTVAVSMIDTSFEPDTVSVTEGETITFRFTNEGKVDHDAFIGDGDAQAEHEEEMRDAGHGGGHGDDDEGITVKPGETGEITHTFDEAGTVEIGCHEPGHYAAGMKVTVEVS